MKLSHKKHKEFIKDNKLILKKQQRFNNDKHNGFTKEINKIALEDIKYYKRKTTENNITQFGQKFMTFHTEY